MTKFGLDVVNTSYTQLRGHGDTDLIGDNSNATQQEWRAALPSAGL